MRVNQWSRGFGRFCLGLGGCLLFSMALALPKGEGATEVNTKAISTQGPSTQEANTKKAGAQEANTQKAGAQEANTKKAGTPEANTKKAGTQEAHTKKTGTPEARTQEGRSYAIVSDFLNQYSKILSRYAEGAEDERWNWVINPLSLGHLTLLTERPKTFQVLRDASKALHDERRALFKRTEETLATIDRQDKRLKLFSMKLAAMKTLYTHFWEMHDKTIKTLEERYRFLSTKEGQCAAEGDTIRCQSSLDQEKEAVYLAALLEYGRISKTIARSILQIETEMQALLLPEVSKNRPTPR